jgi:hypothetical protein
VQPHSDDEQIVRAGLEAAEAADSDARLVLLCLLAGRDVVFDEHEVAAALRRSALLLVAGGDPRRPLELHGRAVTALAEDLDGPERRAQISAGLAALVSGASDLPEVTGALDQLTHDGDLAWQCYAAVCLAEHLADSE